MCRSCTFRSNASCCWSLESLRASILSGMGKKDKQSLRLNVNVDIYLRMNYLFQMAHQVLLTNPDNRNLARFYINLMKKIATRVVLKLDPSIKRAICKKCDLLLLPGVTATVRIRGNRQKHRVIQCLDCHMVKRFVYNPDHILWSERPEARFDPKAAKTDEAESSTASTMPSTSSSHGS